MGILTNPPMPFTPPMLQDEVLSLAAHLEALSIQQGGGDLEEYVKQEREWLEKAFVLALQESQECDIWEGEEDKKCYTYIQDIYYVLRVSFKRAANTQNVQIASAVANLIVKFLEDDLNVVITSMLKLSQELDKYFMALNTLSMAPALTRELGELMRNTPGWEGPVEMAMSGLAAISMQQEERLIDAVEGRLIVNPPPCPATYILTLSEFEKQQRENTFAVNYVNPALLDNGLLPLARKKLTAESFGIVLVRCTWLMTRHLEEYVMNLSFNQLGALKFAEDLRMLVEAACSLIPRGWEEVEVRAETGIMSTFARLKFISTLLNLERAEDAQQLQHLSPLTPEEVKAVLLRRIDFPQAKPLVCETPGVAVGLHKQEEDGGAKQLQKQGESGEEVGSQHPSVDDGQEGVDKGHIETAHQLAQV